MSVAVRELGVADRIMVEELLDRFSPGWTDALAPTASGATAFLTDGGSFMFGAYVDHDPAGWLWGAHLRRPNGRMMTYVHSIDVDETHRRRGIATMLVHAALELARQSKSTQLWLSTNVDNTAARALYESLGGDDGGADDGGSRRFVWRF